MVKKNKDSYTCTCVASENQYYIFQFKFYFIFKKNLASGCGKNKKLEINLFTCNFSTPPPKRTLMKTVSNKHFFEFQPPKLNHLYFYFTNFHALQDFTHLTWNTHWCVRYS